MQVAVEALRERVGADRAISVFHIDQPSNDFNTLFQVLAADPERYGLNDVNVFPSAIGRSFYGPVLPAESVHLGWCSYAAVWLSRIPGPIPGHIVSFRAVGAIREEFDRQAAHDWENFLSLRAKELKVGARLVVLLPGPADDGSSGFENIMDQANDVLTEMVADGVITAEERTRMVLGSHPRRKRDLLAPFGPGGHFENLMVEHLEIRELPDAAWIQYERDGNKEALASKHVLFFRSIFLPSLLLGLCHERADIAGAARIFGDCLETKLKRRLTDQPRPMQSLVQILVLTKREQS
jgi:hypothetical protein